MAGSHRHLKLPVACLGLAMALAGQGCHQVRSDSCWYAKPPAGAQEVSRLKLMQRVAPGVFAGVVVDSATKRPLPGTQIVLRGLNRVTATDSLGAFRFEGLPVGKHIIVVRRIGYVAVSDTIDVTDSTGAVGVYDLSIDPIGLCEVIVAA